MKKKRCNDGIKSLLYQNLRRMRLTVTLLIFTVFNSVAADLYSQTTRLSLDYKNAEIVNVLRDIEDQSTYRFFYNEEVELDFKVDVRMSNKTIDEILAQVFKETGVDFEVIGRQIILKSGRDIKTVQLAKVTGRVSDASGLPLPGVSIVIKGTSTGTISDSNGDFNLINVPNDAILIFSFVGMHTQEIPVAGKTAIDVVLVEKTLGLEEVVAVGYGSMKKSDLTGSIASISSDELDVFPTASVTQALQGRVSGLQVSSTNGAPGSSPRIRVRGSTSINAENSPLFVVDGFAGASLPAAEDIQSVEVLKDASATAIYGSRGANGVILITTKRGKAGELTIEANTSYSIQKVSKTLDLLNGEEFGMYMNDVSKNTGSTDIPYPNPSSLGEGTDWQDVIFRTGALHNHQIAVKGGSDNVEFYSSLKYYGQEGIILNSAFDSYNARMNVNAKLSEKFKTGFQMQFTRGKDERVRTQQNSGAGSGVISSALIFQPELGIYNDDGEYSVTTIGIPRDNPYALLNDRIEEFVSNNFSGNFFLDYEIIKDLTFHSSFGAQLNSGRTGLYLKKTLVLGADFGGQGTISAFTSDLLSNENYLTYSKKIGEDHKLNLVAGNSYISYREESWRATNSGFITDSYLYWNLGAGKNLTAPGSSLTEWKISSFYGRLNYNIKDRYLFTFTGRYDGSSRFGDNNKWAFFPSGSFAWNVKQEPFMQEIHQLSHLKVRASYGVTGNTEIGSYKSLARLTDMPVVLGGNYENAIIPTEVANANLSWESTSQRNIGLDVGLFNGKMSFTADFYNMETEDLLYSVPLPIYTGYSSTLLNWGKVRNRGSEFSLDAVVLDKTFKWDAGFNISFNENEIVYLPGDDVIWSRSPGHIQTSSTHIRAEGQPIGTFFGYVFDGVYQEGDDFSAEPNKVPGNIKYKDTNGRDENGELTGMPDGTVNSDDRAIVGDPNPDFIFGFNNDLSYKNFDLNIFINGSVGNDMINFTRLELETMSGSGNVTTAYFDAWTPTHTNTDVPSVGGNSTEFSSRWVEDGTYVRLKNITLGYSLPSRMLQQLKLQKLRIYVSAQNLFTLTNYSGYDPEASWRDSNSNIGSDYGSYPSTSSYTLGMNIVF